MVISYYHHCHHQHYHLVKSTYKCKRSVSKYSLIFLATICTIISKSISVSATSDLNLSDHNYEPIHKHQYESHPSVAAPTPPIQPNYQWFYSGNDNNNHMNVGSDEQPSALTQIDRFFSTGRFSDSSRISGRFPFDFHQNNGDRHSRHPFERSMLSMPSIPDIPPVPALPQQIHLSYPSSTYFLQRDRDMIYSNKNNYNKNNYQNNGKNRNNDYNHGIKHYTNHDNNHNHNYRRWHSAHNFGHSYHRSYDSGAPNHDSTQNTFWIKTFEPNFSSHFGHTYGPDLEHKPRARTRREHFSRRRSYARNQNQMLPEINEAFVKNNNFFKESHFSWNVEQNGPKPQFKDLSFK